MSVVEYLDIHTDDEELARRGRLLNVLLLGFAIATLVMFFATVVAQYVLRRYETNQVPPPMSERRGGSKSATASWSWSGSMPRRPRSSTSR